MKNKNRSMPSIASIALNLFAIWISIGALTPLNTAHAATSEQEKRIAQCPDGQYAGPGTGTKRFLQDPYVWFVSREFAKRFCVPEQLIDDSLKGALAVAVIIKPDDRTYCGLYAGRSDVCTNKPRLLLEIYVDNRKANIPKADPSVNYFAGTIVNSGEYFGNSGQKYERHYRDEYKYPDGERRPFTPATTQTIRQENATMFKYLGVRKGWATGSGEFIEDYYRANWVDGIDLITLNAYNFGYSGLRNPDLKIQTDSRGGRGYYQEKYDQTNPIQRWAIGVVFGKDYLKDPEGDENRPYPEGYLHTIELPHKIAQMIYAYDHKQGEQFFNTLKRAVTPAATTNPSAK